MYWTGGKARGMLGIFSRNLSTQWKIPTWNRSLVNIVQLGVFDAPLVKTTKKATSESIFNSSNIYFFGGKYKGQQLHYFVICKTRRCLIQVEQKMVWTIENLGRDLSLGERSFWPVLPLPLFDEVAGNQNQQLLLNLYEKPTFSGKQHTQHFCSREKMKREILFETSDWE